MAIFVDTCIFVAARNADDRRHERGSNLMEKALQGEFGTVYTSDYVVDEAITLALIRTKDSELAIDVGKFAISSPRIRILQVTRKGFHGTWEKFKSLREERLSFTDCSTLWLIEENRIGEVMSFDSDFDGLVRRRC